MYRSFFSLGDLPFSISPDPKYLFMSDRHREALSHLTYGLAETGGFALLTGEVGTGKTTVSRCLMEQLPENTQVAFILNPTLSSQELLATLCDELKIRYRKTEATLKVLTDKIAEKLLSNHQQDINTLLIIDEAQHLEASVLEQLRLLTNLETNTKKLLQVILIGQPELQQLLQRRDLRQLAQRITARYHLLPLTKPELAQYINHRLSVAQCHRALFSRSAIAKIHQLSQGIPRLVNLLCHHALLQAYNKNESVVSKKTVLEAGKQVLGQELVQAPNAQNMLMKACLAGTGLFALLVAGFWWGQNNIDQQVTVALENNQQSKLQPSGEVPQSPQHTENLPIMQQNVAPDLINKHKAVAPIIHEKQHEISNSVDEVLIITAETKKQLVDVSTPLPDSINHTEVPVVTRQDQQSKIEKNARQHDVIGKNKVVADEIQAIDGVSDELLALFKEAVNETEAEQSALLNAKHLSTSSIESSSVDARQIEPVIEGELASEENHSNQIKPITQMPLWVQNGVPSLQFEQHIYASDGEGWVTVNGRDRYQGDMINSDLQVAEILPQKVILSFKGQLFSLPALTNW